MNFVKLARSIIKASFDDAVSVYQQSGEEALAYNQNGSRYAVVFRDIARGSLRCVIFNIREEMGQESQTKISEMDFGTVRNFRIRVLGEFDNSEWRDIKTDKEDELGKIVDKYKIDTVPQTGVLKSDRIDMQRALREVYLVIKDGTKSKKEMKIELEKAIAKLSEIKDKL